MHAISLKPSLDPNTQELVRELAEDIAQFDGVSGISEQPLTHLSELGFHHITVWQNHELAAYAHITPPHGEHTAVVELIVKPEYRQEGIATSTITAIRSHYPQAQFWAYGNLAPAQACAEKFMARPKRTLLQLRADISDVPSTIHHDHAVEVRTYRGALDDAEILRINNAAFSWHPEQGNWSPDEIHKRLTAPWFDAAGLFLAEKNGQIVGFHWTKIDPALDPPIGEIYILAVDPGLAGKGIGNRLTQAGLVYFHNLGIKLAELWVESDNTAALKVYAKQGFSRYRTNIAYSIDV